MNWLTQNYWKAAGALVLVVAFLIRGDLFPEQSAEHAAEQSGEQAAVPSESGHADTGQAVTETQADKSSASQVDETEVQAQDKQSSGATSEAAKESAVEATATVLVAQPDTTSGPTSGQAAPAEEVPAEPAQTAAESRPFEAQVSAPEPAQTLSTPATSTPALSTPATSTEPVAEAQPEQWSIREYWVAARTAYWIGDLERAEQEYKEIINREPGNWQALQELGNVYSRGGRVDEAMRMYQQASLKLNELELFEEARQLAILMADLYPLWKKHNPAEF